ncbi:MAG: DUF1990 family protein [Gaiellaceae bacterium]
MADAPLLGDAGARRKLELLRERDVNFQPGSAGDDWVVDEYCQRLPSEPAGDPAPDGSWEVAQQLMREYEFADPSRVRAVYEPDAPLEGRDMLLEIRFLGLRFDVGVRVGGVHDEAREIGGRAARVWGWHYRTLQGHLEMGQMDYELWKWRDSGEVEFRIHRLSRPAFIPNPLVRLGFRIFGRREQVRFAQKACARMLELTEVRLGQRREENAAPSAAEDLAARTLEG